MNSSCPRFRIGLFGAFAWMIAYPSVMPTCPAAAPAEVKSQILSAREATLESTRGSACTWRPTDR